jgi:hypothetical protein
MAAQAGFQKLNRECVVTIDLPGEEVQCWDAKANKLKVLLRKHRDVMFDIQLFKGMTYTVRASKSLVYHANSKKLVRRNYAITFKDGEKLHLWISREFKGVLRLEAAGKTIATYDPDKLDGRYCSGAPEAKPAPIMVVLRNESVSSNAREREIFDRAFPRPNIDRDYLKALENDENLRNHQQVHVFEFDSTASNLPRAIAAFIQAGGQQLTIDPGNVATRNWIFTQLTGLVAMGDDNGAWMKDVAHTKKFIVQRVVHTNGPRYYLIFKGDPSLRKYFTASRYLVENPKVLMLTAASGSVAGLRHASWSSARGAFKGAGGITIVFATVLDVAEWMKDYSEIDSKTGKPKRDFADLFAKIGISLVKVALGAQMVTWLVGLLVAVGAPGILVAAGVVFFTLTVAYGLDYLDSKLGITSKLGDGFRWLAKDLETKMPKDYNGYDSSMADLALYGVAGR